MYAIVWTALWTWGENTGYCLEQCTYGCNSRKVINIEQSLAVANKRYIRNVDKCLAIICIFASCSSLVLWLCKLVFPWNNRRESKLALISVCDAKSPFTIILLTLVDKIHSELALWFPLELSSYSLATVLSRSASELISFMSSFFWITAFWNREAMYSCILIDFALKIRHYIPWVYRVKHERLYWRESRLAIPSSRSISYRHSVTMQSRSRCRKRN